MSRLITCLATAERPDVSGSDWFVVMIAIGTLILAAVLALVPIGLARSRRHPGSQEIISAAVLWGLLVAGSVIYTANARLTWSKEYQLLLKTGYYDPKDTSGAPTLPWGQWGLLAAAYCVLVAYSMSRVKRISGSG